MKKLIALLASLLTGCASIGSFFSGDPTTQQILAKLALQQYVLRSLVKDDPARAVAVIAVVDEANTLLIGLSGADGVISAEELKQVLTLVIPGDLSAADRQLAVGVTELVTAQFGLRIPQDQTKLPVQEALALLSWVREAAVQVAPQ